MHSVAAGFFSLQDAQMACALDKSQLRKRCCCFKELHKDVVSHHMWQN